MAPTEEQACRILKAITPGSDKLESTWELLRDFRLLPWVLEGKKSPLDPHDLSRRLLAAKHGEEYTLPFALPPRSPELVPLSPPVPPPSPVPSAPPSPVLKATKKNKKKKKKKNKTKAEKKKEEE